MDEQEEEMAEIVLAEIEEDEEDVEEAGVGEDTLFSHLALDGDPRTTQGFSDVTWLSSRVGGLSGREDNCEGALSLVDPSQRVGMGIGSAGLADEDVMNLFSTRVGVSGINVLGQVLDNQGQYLFSVCTTGNRDYVLLTSESNSSVFTLAEYDDAHSYWLVYQPVNGVMDGAIGLTANVLGDTPVLATGYGDAGHLWWSYWVPTEYRTLQLIETCTNKPQYAEDGTGTSEVDRILTCGVEYVN